MNKNLIFRTIMCAGLLFVYVIGFVAVMYIFNEIWYDEWINVSVQAVIWGKMLTVLLVSCLPISVCLFLTWAVYELFYYDHEIDKYRIIQPSKYPRNPPTPDISCCPSPPPNPPLCPKG